MPSKIARIGNPTSLQPTGETFIEHRPWGEFRVLWEGETYKVKEIVVNPGERISLQSHKYRSEVWVCVKGKGIAIIEDDVGLDEVKLYPKKSVYVPIEHKHRLFNNGLGELVIIETQIGTYLGEDDIVRYEDDYGRG